MAQGLVTHEYLEDIADAIREKLGTQDTYTPAQMADAVLSIGKTIGVATINGVEYKSPYADEYSISYTRPHESGTKTTTVYTDDPEVACVLAESSSHNSFYFVPASAKSGKTATRNEEGSLSTMSLNSTYTYNGKTVYYVSNYSSYSSLSNITQTIDSATPIGTSSLGQFAWAAVYGAGGIASD